MCTLNNSSNNNTACTEEKYIAVVTKSGHSLHEIIGELQTPKICEAAIRSDPWALEYVKNQTDDLCYLAVQLDYCTLRYVRNKTEKMCRLACERALLHHDSFIWSEIPSKFRSLPYFQEARLAFDMIDVAENEYYMQNFYS